ncbi:hypothetical protein VMCG_04874 [Cytospora schulzeri]|uniref:AAA+ ATPase lid domain-containing protein n=1 Tax=Cytospora schulzeri TaxID=448051 RepID=A0A423WMS8_9PEZI|nr:hypothetical protein VMCG_04874 [Valsa malicola]
MAGTGRHESAKLRIEVCGLRERSIEFLLVLRLDKLRYDGKFGLAWMNPVLYYPPLTEKQTLEIFEVNLRRLREIEAAKAAALVDPDHDDPSHQSALRILIDDRRIMRFARSHFTEHRYGGRWNGRQIRNAFQVAYSLAQSCMHIVDESDEECADDTDDNGKPMVTTFTLDDEQFRTVSKSIERFDKYLDRTRGADADRAKHFQVRNDDFRDDEGPQPRPPRIAAPGRRRSRPRHGPESRRYGPESQRYDPDLQRYSPESQRYGPESQRYDAEGQRYGPESRLGAPRHSPLPSHSGVSDVDMDDQTRSRNRQSAPQNGSSTMSMKPSQSSTRFPPASPSFRREPDFDFASQTLSNSDDYSEEENVSRRGSVGGGTVKHHGRDYSHGGRMKGHKH